MSEDRQPDQAPGARHPREVLELFGHEAAEASLARALAGGRIHHAWMVTGPPGVGKATLAYRFARRFLGAAAAPDSPLAAKADDPVVRSIAIGAHPDLRAATRYDPEEDKVRRDVVVSAIRQLTSHFELKAQGASGRRVGIVDCADDMNDNAANALLKTLEEPPPGGLIILIVNSPGSILRTIRSRCRVLKLEPLDDDALAAAVPGADAATRAIARGCPGRALSLAALDAAGLYRRLSGHLAGLPRAPLADAIALAEAAAGEEKAGLLFDLMGDWLHRAALAAHGLPVREIEPGEAATLARLALPAGPAAIAHAHERLARLRSGMERVNLDRGSAVLEALRAIRQHLSPAAAA
jgi:DNA polymerase III subunit delta'